MPHDYEDTIIPGDEPRISRRYTNGETVTLTGDRAMAMSDEPGAAQWRAENPGEFVLNNYGPDDIRNSTGYAIGSYLRDKAYEKPGMLGRALEGGPMSGALGGGVAGSGAGLLLGLIKRILSGDSNTSYGKWALAGGALGALLGARSGYIRSTTPNTILEDTLAKAAGNGLDKSAAMYKDPRNFILEKLQSATDVNIVDKVQLASSVRNLSREDAEKLAALVRSALGFGVGAIISKFIFGASGAGALFGGLAGMFGANFLVNNFGKKENSSSFDFNFKPLSYRDIL